jgi:L,D-transpeptidase catalytic domain
MLLSRRQIVQAGAVTGALALMPSVAFAQESGPVPAAPRSQLDPMVDPRLVARARASFDRHRAELAHVDTVAVVDFTKASSEPRFFIIDTTSGRVTRHLVAHGRGSDPEHTGFVQRFSNEIRSEATSNGAYVMGDYYPGHYGRSMRVRGLDYSNNNAEARAIVVHTAWYAEPDVIAQTGRLGRSEGCFALPNASLQEAMSRLGPGHFLYADRIA